MTWLRYEACREVPEELEAGVIYVSEKFSVVIHLCACGCKRETVTPTGPGHWACLIANEQVTLSPSILNPCGAHYFVRDGNVVWT